MIIDITGIELVPGKCGNECPGNWEFADLDFCCDECDYMLCCQENHDPKECQTCVDEDCPHSPKCQ